MDGEWEGGESLRRMVVGVMGAGEGASEAEMALARRLGRLIAAAGWVVLSGGRDAGVMAAVNEGAKEVAGSLTVGILPDERARPSPYLDVAIVTGMGSGRNNANALSSDVVVAVGRGGPGTVSEVALALKAGKRVVLLGMGAEDGAFFERLGGGLVTVAGTAEEAIGRMKEAG